MTSAVARITSDEVENLSVFLNENDRIFSKMLFLRFFAKHMPATAAVRAASEPNSSESSAESIITSPTTITNCFWFAISSGEKYCFSRK